MVDISSVVEIGPNLAFVMFTLAVMLIPVAYFKSKQRCCCHGSCKSDCGK
jgi:hypothetical protein